MVVVVSLAAGYLAGALTALPLFAEVAARGGGDPAPEHVTAGSTGTVEGLTVEVAGVECRRVLDDAEPNPALWRTPEADPHVAVAAPDGKEFCVVEATWTNETKQPVLMPLPHFRVLVADDGTQFAAVDDDRGYSRHLTQQAGGTSSDVNPGDVNQTRTVFTVPQDTAVAQVVAEPYGFDEADVWFAVE